jgi:hypothetical protein
MLHFALSHNTVMTSHSIIDMGIDGDQPSIYLDKVYSHLIVISELHYSHSGVLVQAHGFS